MKKVTEFIILVDDEFHSAYITLKEARNIYKQLINIYDVEGKESVVQVIKKVSTEKLMNEYETGDEPIFNAKSFSEEKVFKTN